MKLDQIRMTNKSLTIYPSSDLLSAQLTQTLFKCIGFTLGSA